MAVRVRALVGTMVAFVAVSLAAAPAGASPAPARPAALPPLTVTTTILPLATVGVGYRAVLTATGGTGPYTWRALTPLPAGIVFGSSGVLSGVPRDIGVFTLLFSVSDAAKKQAQSPSLPVTVYKVAPPVGNPVAWGDNEFGELGVGSVDFYRPLPVPMVGLASVRQIAASFGSAYALRFDGTVWATGANETGALGNGTFGSTASVGQVAGLTSVVAIASGGSSAYALRADHTVWAWGSNAAGQLGNDSSVDKNPFPVEVALTSVTAIAAGCNSAYALRSDGTVWAWGSGAEGQLGHGSATVQSGHPVQVSGLAGISGIGASCQTAYAVQWDGTVAAWGDDSNGELGDGGFANSFLPVQVMGVSGVTAVSGGSWDGYALRSDGRVWAWGAAASGELGDNNANVPIGTAVQVSGLYTVTAIAGGARSGYALRSNGTMWAWGANQVGELGDGTLNYHPSPVQVVGLTGVKAIGSGPYSSSAYAVLGG